MGLNHGLTFLTMEHNVFQTKMWYIYTMERYSDIKKNEILSFVTAWVDKEGLMLSEISSTEKNKYHMISLLCGI